MRNDTEQKAASPPSLRCASALRWRKASEGGGGVQKRVRVEKKQEEPRENRGEGGGAVFRKGSGWKGLNWDTLRNQASKAHLKSATRKWCRLFLNRSRFI